MFASKLSDGSGCQSQNFMSEGCALESNFVELSAGPESVEVAQELVDLDVVEGDVGDDLLLDH